MKNKTLNTRLVRHFLYAVLCVFISVGVYGQRETDTVKVVMLMCDITQNDTIKMVFITDIKDSTLFFDRIKLSHFVYWQFGLEVLEKHNTAEGKIDPGHSMCVDERGQIVDCYHDYWVHVKYLNNKGKELPKKYIVWQSVRRE